MSNLQKSKNKNSTKNIYILFTQTWASQVVLMVKNPPANAGDIREVVRSLGWEDPPKEGRATYSSILAGESHGQRSLGHKKSNTAEATWHACTSLPQPPNPKTHTHSFSQVLN